MASLIRGLRPSLLLLVLLFGVPAAALAIARPDLLVTDLSDPPTTAVAGDSFIVSATSKNQGTAAAGPSAVKFYLLNAVTRKNLKGLQNVPSLAPGASDSQAVTVQIFEDTPSGTYFLQGCADGGAFFREADRTNNCRTSAGTITVLDRPNLTVTALSAPPATAGQGQSFDVTSTVQNIGAVTANPSGTKYYLVAFGGVRIDLKGGQPVPSLDPGLTFTDSEPLTVRPETAAGRYRLQGCVDPGKAVSETNENDNCMTSTSTIQVTPRPDLVITSAAVQNAPLTVNPEGSLVIDATVLNQGPADAAGSTLKYQLVNTSDSSTKNLKGTQSVSALISGTSQATQATVTLFSDTLAGTYNVRVCADAEKVVPELSDGNNCTTATGTVTVTGAASALSDLVVTTLTNPPASALPGGGFTVTATVTNNGEPTGVESTTRFYLVGAGGSPRKNLKGVDIVPALGTGASGGNAVTVSVFSDTVPGDYALQACADGDEKLPETNENNNCKTSTGTITVLDSPDLIVTAISDPPASVAQGQTFDVTDTVKNVGAVAAGASTSKYYLVSAADGSRVDLKGTQAVPPLDPDQTFSDQQTVQVRPETPTGAYRVQACADSAKAVLEDNENDNCLTSAGSVQVTGTADLVVTSLTLTAPATVARGGSFVINAVVKNQGLGDAGPSTLKFNLIRVLFAATAKNLKDGTQAVDALVAGASQNTQTTVTVFADTPIGNYAVQACADAGKVVGETSDVNNCITTTATVRVQ